MINSGLKFLYEVYNKLELDLKNINFQKLSRFKPLRSISDIINENIDSTEGRPFTNYFTEAISDYYYQPKPLKRRK
jgi:hypothetical protein